MKLTNLKRTMTVTTFGLATLLVVGGTANAQQRNRGQGRQSKQAGKRQTANQNNRQNQIVTVRKSVVNNNRRAKNQRQKIARQRAAFARHRQFQAQQKIRLQRQRQAQLRIQNQRNRAIYANNSNRYRVYRNGSYYNTTSYGAAILRQAVNRG